MTSMGHSLIRKYYHNMSAYMVYLSTRAENGILSFGLGDWYDFGDYRAGSAENTPVPLVATAHYYMMLDYICQAAKIVGAEGDAEKHASWQKM